MKNLKILTQNFEVKKVKQIDLKSYLTKRIPKIEFKNTIQSFTPPEIFVGRFGYPKVFVGPILTNSENPEIFLLTEKWFGKNFSEIAELMINSIRTEKLVNIYDVENKIVQKVHESLLAKNYEEIEAKILKIKRKFVFHEESKPYGPIALIEDFKIGSYKSNHIVEKVYYDKDLKASEASYFLYKNKNFNEINEYRVYNLKYLANNWVIILFPSKWIFEYIELFHPKTIFKNYFAIGGDYEIEKPIERYAEIGGCYYAARLAVAEKLLNEKKQAGAIILREIYSDYLFPVGVWNVRESVRNALNQKYEKFDDFQSAINYVKNLLKTNLDVWIKNSFVLRILVKNESLNKFLQCS